MHVPRPGPVAAVEGLLERVPELRPAWEEHLRLYEEPLLHVYFGDDLTSIARSAAASGDVALVERLAQGLETVAANRDPDTENAVAVSFVEHLVLGDAADLTALEMLKPFLGPVMTAEVKSYERYRDRPTGSRSTDRGRKRRQAVSEAKKTLEQAIDRWNAADREGWAALYTDDVVYEAPGGSRITGLADLKEKYFDALLTAAPDRASSEVILFAEGDHVVEQARYIGTHTGTWRSPEGAEVPATGRKLDFPFVGIFKVDNGKISQIRIYYDQVEVFTQLGLMPGVHG